MSKADVEALNRDLMPGLYEDDYDDGDTVATVDRGDDIADEPEQDSVDAVEDETPEEPEVEAEAETEDEPEPEPEVAEEDDEPKEKPKKILIPKSRLDDEIAKRRKLESDLAELQKQHQKVETTKAQDEAFESATKEANTLLRQANEAVLDGELDKAAELQQQALVKMSRANQATRSEEIDHEAIYNQIEAKLELKHTLKDIYANYPEFNHESETADSAMIERAVMYEKMYAEMGHTPAEAVRRAVEDTLKVLAPERLAEEPVQTKKPMRETTNLKSKVDAAKKAPPKAKTTSAEEPALDITALSEEDFDALPESTKARLRGDFG